MPFRDHFGPPLDNITSWEGFHGGWPMVIVTHLNRKLPRRYIAEPRVHLASSIEIGVPTYEQDESELPLWSEGNGESGTATAVWAPPRPTLSVKADLPAQAEYEVRVYDTERRRRLVAAIEIVSPSNKDRPEHRRAFVAKCAALLQEHVSVAMVDLVTTRQFNLYGDLLEMVDKTVPALEPQPPALYAAEVRGTKKDQEWLLETWMHALVIGQPLPTLPLWVADNLAVPLELEATYEETCRGLRLI